MTVSAGFSLPRSSVTVDRRWDGGNLGSYDGVEPIPFLLCRGGPGTSQPGSLVVSANNFAGALNGPPTSKSVTVTYAINNCRCHHRAPAGTTRDATAVGHSRASAVGHRGGAGLAWCRRTPGGKAPGIAGCRRDTREPGHRSVARLPRHDTERRGGRSACPGSCCADSSTGRNTHSILES